MFCPMCQAVVHPTMRFCSACGAPVRTIAAADIIEVVEGTVDVNNDHDANGSLDAQLAAGGRALQPRDTAGADSPPLAIISVPRRVPPALALLPVVSAIAWRQPAVRAVVKTSASAVAFSLAMRVARRWLSGQKPGRALTQSVLPAVADMQRQSGLPRHDRRSGPVEVTEAFMYVRRIVRQ